MCTTSWIPTLELVVPPKHGTVRFVATDIGAPPGSGCSNSVYGQAVLYRPDPGFVGEDQFTYYTPAEAGAGGGGGTWSGYEIAPAGPRNVIVTVRDQSAGAR